MANEGLAVDVNHARQASWIDEAVLLAFLLLAFVGLSPFAPPPPDVAAFGQVGTTGAGDLARQLCYLAVLGAIVIGAARARGLQAVSSVPVLLALLLVWCLFSALWSGEPGVTLRRAGLAVVLVISAMLIVETVGAERSLVLWRWVLAAVLIVNIASIHFIPQAVHLPGEADTSLVGDWRGLYGHKNIAGSVGAMTAIIFLLTPRASPSVFRKLLDVAIAIVAVGFTVMTRSKSSLGLLVIALIAGIVYRIAWKKELDRTIVVIVGALLAIMAAVFVLSDPSMVVRLFEDPQEFTGRTEIWAAEVAYIRDHALLGAGFGTFSDTGGISPLHNYIGNSWVGEASHGHNGYLQLLVTVGVIGFLLAFAGLIVAPALMFWKRGGDIETKALLFALFAFLLMHNLMETDFLEGDGVAWVAYLLMLAMLGNLARRGPVR
ncbi:MAG: O-antigen ligase family protein [Rhizomicrobium sp.]